MPVQATKGAASAQGFGQISGGSGEKVYIEDVFSTYLYTGNGSSQNIVNGIDLAGKGGMAWFAVRNYSGYNHAIVDTARDTKYTLYSNTTAAQVQWDSVTPLSNGFSVNNASSGNVNQSGGEFVSWTFRKQPKFFDIVTYTGNGSNPRNIAHNLGSTPGCIIVKALSSAGVNDWMVYHRGINTSVAYTMYLNSNGGFTNSAGPWNNTNPTETEFTVNVWANYSGINYVAYIFAHNAGGFGLSGSDNVITCGSYAGNGSASGPVINLGYEPQWVMIKNRNDFPTACSWNIFDNMRGLVVGGADAYLAANSSDAETAANWLTPTATGFQIVSTDNAVNNSVNTYIYIAIRRGPMKVPTSGTSVYKSNTRTGNGTEPTITGVGFVPDLIIPKHRQTGSFGNSTGHLFADRLRGNNNWLFAPFTDGETGSGGNMFSSASQTYNIGWSRMYESGIGYVDHVFRRAPGFFDEVCYTGTGAATTVNHNLGAAPELMIFRNRGGGNWIVCSNISTNYKRSFLEASDAATTLSFNTVFELSAAPTASVINMGSATTVNTSGGTYVAYLFATCAGVSKVGGYTGTGTTQQINCGFTGGARFVLIKRTDSTGDWYVWDSARGIVAGNDPYLLLNSTAAEVTSTDYIDTYSAGFEISSTAPAAINASGGTFIYLAIA